MENSPIGKIFVQEKNSTIGKSSYHFDASDNVYIRFDGWNSNRFPQSKQFTHTKFDNINRVFIGLIDWSTEGGHEGAMYWLYLMTFNEDYSKIIRGYVVNDGQNIISNFATNLSYVRAPSKEPSKQEPSSKLDGRTENEIKSKPASLPFKNIDSDRFYDSIIKINSINNIGSVVDSFFSSSDRANSQTKKNFQSYVARNLTSFRKDIIDDGGHRQFKNDLATTEICGAVMAIAFAQMNDRGINAEIASRILTEGIRATFNIQASAQANSVGKTILKIIESYKAEDGYDLEFTYLNILTRLVGSNLNGKLMPTYFEILQDYSESLMEFLPTMDPGFTRFMKKVQREADYLIDGIMDIKWNN